MNSVRPMHVFILVISLLSTLAYCLISPNAPTASKQSFIPTGRNGLVNDKINFIGGSVSDDDFSMKYFYWELNSGLELKFNYKNSTMGPMIKRADGNDEQLVLDGEIMANTQPKVLYKFDLSDPGLVSFMKLTVKEPEKVYTEVVKDASATLLHDGKIVYVGGKIRGNSEFVSPFMVLIYDTTNSIWTQMRIKSSVEGRDPIRRAGHSAVLGPDDLIYIYGGYSEGPVGKEVAFMTLDTNTWEYTFLDYETSPTEIQSYHVATVYGNFMVIAFGSIGDDSKGTRITNIFDFKQKKWLAKKEASSDSNYQATGCKLASERAAILTS
ncbi:7614_t:CDS:2, partial [Funneliformis caledonium]